MQADSSTGEFFANNRDVLDAILLKLTGAQAARVAATCRAFRDALAPAAALWAEYYASEFGDADFSFAASVTWARRFQTAYRRLQLCAARWNRGRAGEDDAGPGARQGAASCAFTLAAFGGCFAVYGGWTDMHGISRDLHVLRRRESAASDSNYYWTPCMIAVTARPGPAPRQVYSGPSRATYGVTVSAAQSVGGSDGPGAQVERVKLLVLGGVTSGGYRGATGALHTIELRSTLVEHVLTGAQAARLSAEWTEESSVGGRPITRLRTPAAPRTPRTSTSSGSSADTTTRPMEGASRRSRRTTWRRAHGTRCRSGRTQSRARASVTAARLWAGGSSSAVAAPTRPT